MPDVVKAAHVAGALGCVLSGAGPSLLAVVAGDDTPVAAAMEAALRRAGMAGAARRFDVDTAGAGSRGIGWAACLPAACPPTSPGPGAADGGSGPGGRAAP